MKITSKLQRYIRPTSKFGIIVYNIWYNRFFWRAQMIYWKHSGKYYVKVWKSGKAYSFECQSKGNITFVYECFILDVYGMDKKKKMNLACDVGANIGIFSVRLSEKCKKLIAFEPSSANRQLWLKNTRRNGVKNAQLFPYAVADFNGDGKLNIHKEDLCNTLTDYQQEHFIGSENVQIRRIDTIIKEPVDYAKIDVEGYEQEAVRGMQKLPGLKNTEIFLPDC